MDSQPIKKLVLQLQAFKQYYKLPLGIRQTSTGELEIYDADGYSLCYFSGMESDGVVAQLLVDACNALPSLTEPRGFSILEGGESGADGLPPEQKEHCRILLLKAMDDNLPRKYQGKESLEEHIGRRQAHRQQFDEISQAMGLGPLIKQAATPKAEKGVRHD